MEWLKKGTVVEGSWEGRLVVWHAILVLLWTVTKMELDRYGIYESKYLWRTELARRWDKLAASCEREKEEGLGRKFQIVAQPEKRISQIEEGTLI